MANVQVGISGKERSNPTSPCAISQGRRRTRVTRGSIYQTDDAGDRERQECCRCASAIFVRCMSPFMALKGPSAYVRQCLLIGDNQTCRERTLTATLTHLGRRRLIPLPRLRAIPTHIECNQL